MLMTLRPTFVKKNVDYIFEKLELTTSEIWQWLSDYKMNANLKIAILSSHYVKGNGITIIGIK